MTLARGSQGYWECCAGLPRDSSCDSSGRLRRRDAAVRLPKKVFELDTGVGFGVAVFDDDRALQA